MTGSAEPRPFVPITAKIREHMHRRPEAAAVLAGNETLTFQGLERWSQGVHARLQEIGVEPGDPVAVLMEQGLATAPAVLGVLRAGGGYVPIAPGEPAERARFILADTGASIVLTDGTLGPEIRSVLSGIEIIDVQEVRESATAVPDPVEPDPDLLAYILYTSGSSGRPKGVMVSHRALSYYVGWHCDHLAPAIEGAELPLISSICFAAGVTQLYAPLTSGRTLHVLDRGVLHDPEQLFNWYEAHRSFGLYCVPTLWSELLSHAVAEASAGRKPAPPHCVLLSGEEVTASLVERSREVFPETRLWNLYGPTETTANATFAELNPGRAVTIGRAIHGTEVTLRAPDLSPVDPGQPGEICVSGPGLATGYANLPDLTEERFVPYPGSENGRRLFRTGDLAVMDDAGDLQFMGRRDFQVKIRGHRVECGEVEAVLAGHPGVRQAVVVPTSDEGATRLIAYIVFRFARYASVDTLREFASGVLAGYMIPSSFVLLDELPKLKNGKVDRKRLPPPGRDRPLLGYEFVPPRDLREQRVIRIWEEVLGIEGIGVEDEFLDLGGDSLKATAALARLAELSGTRISYGDFFDHSTPAGIGRLLTSEEEPAVEHTPLQAEAPAGPPQTLEGIHPCSDNQKGLWHTCRTYPDLDAYNVQFSVFFEGRLDVDALERALGDLVERHEALRTVFPTLSGEPMAEVRPPATERLPQQDVRAAEATDVATAEASAAALVDEARQELFELDRGPLYRFLLMRTGDERWRLVVTVHHIVFDGRSIGPFSRELLARYRDRRREDATAAESAGALHTPDYGAWVHRRLAAAAAGHEAGARYWTDALADAPTVLPLPTDHPRPRLLSFRGTRTSRRVDPALREALARVSRSERATPFMALLGIFNVLLHRYTGQTDILVGAPVANRELPGDEDRIGYLANTAVLRTRVEGPATFRELLSSVRARCLEAYEHQAFPFERLVEQLRPERTPGQTPLFQVMFAFHEGLPSERAEENLRARVREDDNPGAKFDLTVDVHDEDDGMVVALTYRSGLYSDASMERFLDRFLRLAAEVAADPDRPLREHALLLPSEVQAMEAWNRTDRENARDLGLERLFEEQVARVPQRTALVAGDVTLSFGELDRAANRLAHHLRGLGAKPGETVGVHLEPSADMIVAILAVLKAGAAYVPLDPYYPRDRIDYVLEDSGVGTVITDAARAKVLPAAGPQRVVLEELGSRLAEYPDQAPGHDAGPEDPMYIMYTSGSSGRPKGVVVPHRGPANYVLWMRDSFPMAPDDRVLCRTSINFDISVWEIFLPLVSGVGLVVALPHQSQAPEALAGLIRDQGVTQVQFVPSALRAFVDGGELTSCPDLRRIFSGGETLSAGLQDEVFAAFAGEVHNLYGPTEASIYSCHWECRREQSHRSVPIGHPIHNTRIHILDADGEPVIPGAVGEIYIGGVGVALGYHGLPEATTSAFLPDRFYQDGEALLFKTGDSGRYMPDGEIEFLGRSDRLVKVRGYRIELGEIEHHLATHPQVNHAIIIVREDEESDQRLVAYLLYNSKKGPEADELRAHLRQKLPDYMIPSHFETLESIPMLPNDKADVNSLPEPEYRKKVDSKLSRHYASDSERVLTAIWEEVLGHGKFGSGDSFFDVGGHSLLIAKLGTRIEERLGVRVSNIDLFQFPTIRSLARHLDDAASPGRQASIEMTRRAALGARLRPSRPGRPGSDI